jgi:hypothetical protein
MIAENTGGPHLLLAASGESEDPHKSVVWRWSWAMIAHHGPL